MGLITFIIYNNIQFVELLDREVDDIQEKDGLTLLRTIATYLACHWRNLSVQLKISAGGGLC